MKDIVIMGIQGSGKGVQSRLILDEYGDSVDYFEMGQILRDISGGRNVLGKYIESCVNKGDLVADEFAAGIFDLFVQTLGNKKYALLDGYPRTPEQLKLFLKVMKARKRDFIVICLCLEKEISIMRITNRRLCKECGKAHNLRLEGDITNCTKCGGKLYQRDDEKDIDVVERRVQHYIDITEPLVKDLEIKGHLVKIDADQSIDVIFKEIKKILD